MYNVELVLITREGTGRINITENHAFEYFALCDHFRIANFIFSNIPHINCIEVDTITKEISLHFRGDESHVIKTTDLFVANRISEIYEIAKSKEENNG